MVRRTSSLVFVFANDVSFKKKKELSETIYSIKKKIYICLWFQDKNTKMLNKGSSWWVDYAANITLKYTC